MPEQWNISSGASADYTTFTLNGLAAMPGADADSNLDRLLERMAREEFDMIAVGRALVSNWDWPNMVREGRLHEARAFEGAHLKVLY